MIFPPAKKLLCEKQELTSDLICCLNVTNNCNLPCHSIDLIMWWTIALPLFWTSSRPMPSPWWYIIPLGRQVNYKLAPNTRCRWSPPSEGNATAVVVCVCLYVCGQWGKQGSTVIQTVRVTFKRVGETRPVSTPLLRSQPFSVYTLYTSCCRCYSRNVVEKQDARHIL